MPVVGHDLADADALAGKPGFRTAEECRGGDPALVAEHLDVGQTGRVVDGDVHELPADAPDPSGAVAVDAVPRAANPPELLDVQVHQRARRAALVPALRRPRLERAQAAARCA